MTPQQIERIIDLLQRKFLSHEFFHFDFSDAAELNEFQIVNGSAAE
jgi:hypothetical protein